VLVMLVPMAMLAGFFVMMVMVFVYHGSVHFPGAKVRRPACNRVAKRGPRIGFLAGNA
jgi:hypothetical protein